MWIALYINHLSFNTIQFFIFKQPRFHAQKEVERICGVGLTWAKWTHTSSLLEVKEKALGQGCVEVGDWVSSICMFRGHAERPFPGRAALAGQSVEEKAFSEAPVHLSMAAMGALLSKGADPANLGRPAPTSLFFFLLGTPRFFLTTAPSTTKLSSLNRGG